MEGTWAMGRRGHGEGQLGGDDMGRGHEGTWAMGRRGHGRRGGDMGNGEGTWAMGTWGGDMGREDGQWGGDMGRRHGEET